MAAGGSAIGLSVDVTDRAQIDQGVATTGERLGRPTVLVNSAGLDGFDPFLKITAEKWNRIIAVNLTGTFDCCQAVVPDMIEAGWGRIVNISSSSAQSGQPIMTHYVASKAGVIGFTKALALELGPRGITVNTIPPGFIDTPCCGVRGPGAWSRKASHGAAREIPRPDAPHSPAGEDLPGGHHVRHAHPGRAKGLLPRGPRGGPGALALCRWSMRKDAGVDRSVAGQARAGEAQPRGTGR